MNFDFSSLIDNNYKTVKKIVNVYEHRRVFLFRSSDKLLGGSLLKKIIDFSGTVLNSKFRLPVVIIFEKITIRDKLSYILLECVIYHLINYGYDVQVLMNPDYNIGTKGIIQSPLNFLNPRYTEFEKRDKVKRKNQFLKHFELFQGGKYRKWISKDDDLGVSRLTTDLLLLFREQYNYFPNYADTDYENVLVQKLATTIGELVDNAHEHGGSDCLVDIDFSHDFIKKSKNDGTFGGLNVTIINFSKRTFGEKVKYKILNTDLNDERRYLKVREIFDNHKKFFNNKYTEDIFWFIASLQDKISGRNLHMKNGGKGSTELIKSIQEFTHDDYCYIMSGKNIINLKKRYLNLDSDGFIGFNDSSFISASPSNDSFSRSSVYFPGVAYNLNFVLEEVTNDSN